MIRKYRYLTLLSTLLVLLGIFIWTITRRTSLQVAEGKLSEAGSYGEIKGVWLEYQKDLGDSPEWIDLVSSKLHGTSLTTTQWSDMQHWFPAWQESTVIPEKTPATQAPSPQPARADSSISAAPAATAKQEAASENGLSGPELAAFYNRQGDEKCKAFKSASAPHLYHIANEYYQRAAAITHTDPSVCE
ncbi:hypothetical protein [Dyadobacter sandarakinus]|uniref:Uncharacterized protein n=1 Tax=Dyadobacter sandarakinus TaxID=2747268 RepID=A0ABX7I4G2_9BACT|nr:hypothetical protein [Dyadobacter sandarakinus]QRR00598.1 hypothetical protein HWI92_06600 [Dyadobacter sandarakinus]